MKKILYMGTPDFAVPALEALINSEKYQVIGLVTQPDRKVGRKKELTPPVVKKAALKYDLPIYQPEKIKESQELEALLGLDIDLIVTAAYGQILPKSLLDKPKYGAINIHASLLPKYRGAAPIHYAVKNGDSSTGVTLMYMEEELDAGDMIAQSQIPIEDTDDTGTLFEKLSILGRDLLMDTLDDLFEGNIQVQPQNPKHVTFAPMISREQEQIDWSLSALEIHNLVRGLRPFPGAYTLLDGQRFKIWGTELAEGFSPVQAGQVVKSEKDVLVVAGGDGKHVSLTHVQPSGKGKQSIDQFQAGNRLEVGKQFG